MDNNQEFTLLFQPPARMRVIEKEKDNFMKKRVSLYIHIPFCEKKCFFCSIVTCQKFNDGYIEDYVKVLINEIYEYREYFTKNKIDAVHIGGGTPSLIKLEQIQRVFLAMAECIPNFSELEVVFESEASSLSDEKMDFLAQSGKVALNMGVQTFDSESFF